MNKRLSVLALCTLAGTSILNARIIDVIVESGAKNIDIGIIYLDDAKNLQEITVTGNSMVHSQGRTIVYPSSADVKASSTSTARRNLNNADNGSSLLKL